MSQKFGCEGRQENLGGVLNEKIWVTNNHRGGGQAAGNEVASNFVLHVEVHHTSI